MNRLLTAAILAMVLTSCAFAVQRTLDIPAGCSSWSPLPLTVSVDESAEEYRDDVARGMRAWNEAMHQPAFDWAANDQMPDVTVAMGPTHRERERGFTSAFCLEGKVVSAVVLQPALDSPSRVNFAAHELGHALGLGHSPNDQSVMHATLRSDLLGPWDDEHSPRWYRVLPSDARLAAALHADYASAVEVAPPVDDDPIADGIGTSPSDPDADLGGYLGSMLNAAKQGQWRMLAGLLLIGVVWAARKWGSGAVPWLKTDRGGAALVLAMALLGGVATTLMADGPFGWGLLVNSLSMAMTAAGGWAILKKLLAPSDGKAV